MTRGTDGKLRAFLNVCRHRSATVELKPCGSNKRAFVCPYHGWSYDLTGKLLGITDGAWFGEVDRAHARAAPARRRRALRHGLRGADGARGRARAPTSTSMPSSGRSSPISTSWDMQGWEVHSYEPIRPRMNWKLVIDTFLELYHFRYLHGASVCPLFLDNIATYERRSAIPRFAVCQALDSSKSRTQPRENWRLLDHAIVLYQLFPNTVLAYTQDHCGVFTSFPVSPDEALINVSILVDPGGAGEEAGKLLEDQPGPDPGRARRGFHRRRHHPGELQERRQPRADLRQVREGAGLVSPGDRRGAPQRRRRVALPGAAPKRGRRACSVRCRAPQRGLSRLMQRCEGAERYLMFT